MIVPDDLRVLELDIVNLDSYSWTTATIMSQNMGTYGVHLQYSHDSLKSNLSAAFGLGRHGSTTTGKITTHGHARAPVLEGRADPSS
jgi:hypothetical protein